MTTGNSDKQDEDWFELLAGRAVPDAEALTQAEAKALRTAILSQLDRDRSATDDLEQARGLQQVLARLSAEGLLDDARSPPKRWPYVAVAASLVLGLSVWLILLPTSDPLPPQTSPDFQPPPLVRGGLSTQSIPVSDREHGRAIARQLIQQASQLGIPYRFTPLAGPGQPDWQLEIYIPLEPSDNILTFLRQWRLEESENGWLRIQPAAP